MVKTKVKNSCLILCGLAILTTATPNFAQPRKNRSGTEADSSVVFQVERWRQGDFGAAPRGWERNHDLRNEPRIVAGPWLAQLQVPIFVSDPFGYRYAHLSSSPVVGFGLLSRVGYQFQSLPGFEITGLLGLQWAEDERRLIPAQYTKGDYNQSQDFDIFRFSLGSDMRYTFITQSRFHPFIGAGVKFDYWSLGGRLKQFDNGSVKVEEAKNIGFSYLGALGLLIHIDSFAFLDIGTNLERSHSFVFNEPQLQITPYVGFLMLIPTNGQSDREKEAHRLDRPITKEDLESKTKRELYDSPYHDCVKRCEIAWRRFETELTNLVAECSAACNRGQ